MGKTSDDSSNTDRSRSWARALVWDKNASAEKQAPILPTSEPRQQRVADDGVARTSPELTPVGRQDTHSSPADAVSKKNVPDNTSAARPAATPPPKNTEAPREESAALDGEADPEKPKLSLSHRAKAGSKRFVTHTKDALLHSYINILLIFVPIGIAVQVANLSPVIIFAMNAVAIVPLAGLLSFATESVASRLGDTLGALLNVSFGNAVELIIL